MEIGDSCGTARAEDPGRSAAEEAAEAVPAERVRLERRLIVLWIFIYHPQTFYSY